MSYNDEFDAIDAPKGGDDAWAFREATEVVPGVVAVGIPSNVLNELREMLTGAQTAQENAYIQRCKDYGDHIAEDLKIVCGDNEDYKVGALLVLGLMYVHDPLFTQGDGSNTMSTMFMDSLRFLTQGMLGVWDNVTHEVVEEPIWSKEFDTAYRLINDLSEMGGEGFTAP